MRSLGRKGIASFVLLGSCLAIISGSGGPTPASAAVAAKGPPALRVSAAGNDASPCTRGAPCRTFDRAYQIGGDPAR